MVDLTGKFFLLDELDEKFVKECVDVEQYQEYQGRWVKNAYDPQFTVMVNTMRKLLPLPRHWIFTSV